VLGRSWQSCSSKGARESLEKVKPCSFPVSPFSLQLIGAFTMTHEEQTRKSVTEIISAMDAMRYCCYYWQ